MSQDNGAAGNLASLLLASGAIKAPTPPLDPPAVRRHVATGVAETASPRGALLLAPRE